MRSHLSSFQNHRQPLVLPSSNHQSHAYDLEIKKGHWEYRGWLGKVKIPNKENVWGRSNYNDQHWVWLWHLIGSILGAVMGNDHQWWLYSKKSRIDSHFSLPNQHSDLLRTRVTSPNCCRNRDEKWRDKPRAQHLGSKLPFQTAKWRKQDQGNQGFIPAKDEVSL